MYDYAGECFRVGIPSKSGVSGGIVGVVPGQFWYRVFSPALDAKGNSVRGIRVFQKLSDKFGLHVYEGGSKKANIRAHLLPYEAKFDSCAMR